jgi:hypothetical protein
MFCLLKQILPKAFANQIVFWSHQFVTLGCVQDIMISSFIK